MNLKCFLAAEKKLKCDQPNYCTSYILCCYSELDSLTGLVGQNRNTNSNWGVGWGIWGRGGVSNTLKQFWVAGL